MEKGFNTTLDKAKNLDALGIVVQAPNDPNTLIGRFLYNLQFTDPGAKDIIQAVTSTVTFYGKDGKPLKGSGVPDYFVEGWATDNNGAAVRLDTHRVLNLPLRKKFVSKSEIVISFKIGAGLFDKKQFPTPPAPYAKTNTVTDKKIFDAITWTGKTREYKLTFVMYPDGKWELTDTGANLSLSGTFDKVNK